jgi:hypothetical protein
MRIRLFTSLYDEKNAARSRELAESLRRNLHNPAFDEICVFVEGEAGAPAPSERIQIRRSATRPTYADYFDWISELASPEDISILANSDIFFDSQIDVFRVWALPKGEALCLSRWETADKRPYLNDRNDSQDAWIFKGEVRDVAADFAVGVPRCDNRIAHQLEAAGYIVRNPAFSLRAFHLHAGRRYEYPLDHQENFVPPPYRYMWPHNLWSLPKTLAHNSRYPALRVFWRVDRRKLSRSLKLHWFSKLYRGANNPLAL